MIYLSLFLLKKKITQHPTKKEGETKNKSFNLPPPAKKNSWAIIGAGRSLKRAQRNFKSLPEPERLSDTNKS